MNPLIAVVVGLLSAAAAPPQKPVVEKPFHLPNRSTITTTDEMWAQSAIVIEGLVTSSDSVVTSETSRRGKSGEVGLCRGNRSPMHGVTHMLPAGRMALGHGSDTGRFVRKFGAGDPD